MATENDLSIAQFTTIKEFLIDMIDAADNGRLRFMTIPKECRTQDILNQIAYYKHAVGGYKWAIEVARQRTPAVRNVK